MTQTPLERAARALCRLDGHPDEAAPWRGYLPAARAALEAVRLPSYAMVLAAGREDVAFHTPSGALETGRIHVEDDWNERGAATVFAAMIDAALDEPAA